MKRERNATFFHSRSPTLRLLLGPSPWLARLTNVPRWIYLPILVTATLSDIYDGILARRFSVATPALHNASKTLTDDVIYYLFIPRRRVDFIRNRHHTPKHSGVPCS